MPIRVFLTVYHHELDLPEIPKPLTQEGTLSPAFPHHAEVGPHPDDEQVCCNAIESRSSPMEALALRLQVSMIHQTSFHGAQGLTEDEGSP